jgi:hypothetical protein
MIATAACSRISAAPIERRFVCNKFGFSMLVPPGWNVKTIGVLPMFFSLDPGDSIPVIHLPEGMATIHMGLVYGIPRGQPSPQWLRTLRDYTAGAAHGGGDTNPVLAPFQFPPEAGISEAIVVTWDLPISSPPKQVHHSVMICWRFQGNFLDACLHYVVGDPKGAEQEETFFQTIRSFRPLRK